MTEAQAREEVERKAQAALEPALDSTEIDAALSKHRRFFEWEAGAEVEYGRRVAPSVRNGRLYRAVQGGTTGVTEPSWGTTDYSRVTDGSVVWEEGGVAGEQWDVRGAVYDAVLTKMSKAVSQNQYLQDGRAAADKALYENLQRLLDMYRPVGVA